MTQLVWLRHDLRTQDNPALYFAAQKGPVLVVYSDLPGRQDGSYSAWWRSVNLKTLSEALDGNLHYSPMPPLLLFKKILERNPGSIKGVHWNRFYEKETMDTDDQVGDFFKTNGIEYHTYKGSLLFEPWEIQNNQQTFFKVFTPFWKNCLTKEDQIQAPLTAPTPLTFAQPPQGVFEALPLVPCPLSDAQSSAWPVGEAGGQSVLASFVRKNLENYAEKRDFPAANSVSRLSPYLKLGVVSPRQIWHFIKQQSKPDNNTRKFLAELGWREFSYHLLYHFPKLGTENFQAKFSLFPWRKQADFASDFNKWTQGLTGYPLVDAGMRELNSTGFMHNRVRMVVASFLTKNLLIPWQTGELYFWDRLLDADPANNTASWQWVAGSGADAAPYFRVFNPVLQSKKFDPTGQYIKKWVPELASVPEACLHSPWESGKGLHSYPGPMVDLSATRERALLAYENLQARQ